MEVLKHEGWLVLCIITCVGALIWYMCTVAFVLPKAVTYIPVNRPYDKANGTELTNDN